MKYPSREQVEKIREAYPVGTKVELVSPMCDPQSPPAGAIGEVQWVDDLGDLGVRWNTGSSLKLIIGEDIFRKV